jgi:Fic family protein
VKSGDKKSNRLAENSDYVANKGEIRDNRLIPTGSPISMHWFRHITELITRTQERDNQHGPGKGRL